MFPEVRSSRRERRHARRKKQLIIAGAATAGLFLLYLIIGLLNTMAERREIREQVRGGGVVASGLNVQWNVEANAMLATAYVLNTSAVCIRGHLVFELSPNPERLDRLYLEKFVEGRREQLLLDRLQALEQSRRLDPRNTAILSYLRRGHTTSHSAYELVDYATEAPPRLVFRKQTLRVVIQPGELASCTLTQRLPESKMGEALTLDGLRLVGIEF